MTSEHLLDAIGLLDDDLIQEAEQQVRRKTRYRQWMGWAACIAAAVLLTWAAPNFGMESGNMAPVSGEPSSSYGGTGEALPPPAPGGSCGGTGETLPPPAEPSDSCEPGAPNGGPSSPGGEGAPGGAMEPPGDWLGAIRVDGTVYWDTGEYIRLEPEEDEIRYTTSFMDWSEPQEDGQANFGPAGAAYVVLDNGTVAARMEEEGDFWCVFSPVRPWAE